MKKELVHEHELKLVGLTVRTNNKNEMNPTTSKIGKLFAQYLNHDVAGQILNRKKPGVTLSVYTDYESDANGDYTYFVGEEVIDFKNVPSTLQKLTIPATQYQKFTTLPGPMPEVVIKAWQEIWQMSAAELGGQRAYQADFEVYDERASDPAHTIVDIYIGIKSD